MIFKIIWGCYGSTFKKCWSKIICLWSLFQPVSHVLKWTICSCRTLPQLICPPPTHIQTLCILLWLISTCEKQSTDSQPLASALPFFFCFVQAFPTQSDGHVGWWSGHKLFGLACSKMEIALHPRSPTLAWIRSLGKSNFLKNTC